MRKNLEAYQNVSVKSNLASADPHQVITLMYNGLLESLAQAKGAIERNNYEKKSTLLTKSINILQSLKNSLDRESEPEISQNFDQLYSFCIDCIHGASHSLDITAIDQVINFLSPLRDAWQEMPEKDKIEGFELLQQRNQKQADNAGA
jgi:flagellar protein FliS